jgi:uncharacterized protein (TIGR02118 family)
MFRVAILYPSTEGATFDHDYYLKSHMPMVAGHLGTNCASWGVDKVLDGPHVAIGYLVVEDITAFQTAMAEHGAEILGDLANYTTIAPQIVVSQLVA